MVARQNVEEEIVIDVTSDITLNSLDVISAVFVDVMGYTT
jgi:hypothetical protein